MSNLEKKQGYRSIPFNLTIIKHFIDGNTQADDDYKATALFQLSNGFHSEEDYPFKEFNILNHKEAWANQLKSYMSLPETEFFALKEKLLPKRFYYIEYQYYMIKENVHFISDEAKINVQKIHDLEMPSSYFYELRDLINSL